METTDNSSELSAKTDSLSIEDLTSQTIVSQGEFSLHIQEVRDAVYRLLKYAASDASRNLSQSLIEQIVPVLQKNAAQFTSSDETTLWSSYSQLSVLVAPATNESLWLKEQMERDDRAQAEGNSGDYSFTAKAYKKTYASFKWTGYLFGIIFFLLQSYTVMLSNSLEQVEKYYAGLAKVETQILAAKQANPDISPCNSPIKELSTQEDELLLKIDSHYRAMQKLSKAFWGYLYTSDTLAYYSRKPPQCRDSTANIPFSNMDSPTEWALYDREREARAERSTFFEGAKSTLRLCNYLILPLILGTLGSVAYVIRNILDSFSRASLSFASNRRGGMRVYLGCLLGLISGVVIAPDIKEIQEISYSPLVWAFLMGYSVEFAFTFFDALIERGRAALHAIKMPETPVKETISRD